MALPQIQNLKPSDLLKLLRFSTALIENFDDFISTTLKCLQNIFDYPISTYTIFDDDSSGARYIACNFSNFFSSRDLEFYENEGYKNDISFQNRIIDWANNSSKYVFVTEFKAGTSNPYVQAMVQQGIKYQVRLGAHAKASVPVHVLSVYKPLGCEPLDEYELLLLSAIGQIFSEQVGLYKSYERHQKNALLYAQYLDTLQKAIAIYDPHGNALNYNRTFYVYATQLNRNKSVHSFVSDLIIAHRQSAEAAPVHLERTTTTDYRDHLITVSEKQLDLHHGTQSFYIIAISEKTCEKAQKPAVRRQYILNHLTAREIEVVQLVEEGLNNKEISERLIISMPTVKSHIKNIFSKFGVSSRAELLKQLQD